jgi:pheromone shutdown-related protein TraB
MEKENNREMIHHLTAGGKAITLIGTAHVSKESAELVKAVIEEQRPDTVCVELCESRYQAISQKERWQNTDIIKIIKEKKTFLLLSNLMLAAFQKRIAQKLDVVPGQEMITALESAKSVGAATHLADRDIRVTLSRTWRLMGIWDKTKLFSQLLLSMGDMEDITEADVEKMKQEDVLETLLSEVGQHMPVLRDILIDERDQYLTEKIRNAPGEKIVAVVGAGHVPGIKKYWEAPIDMAALETLPPKRKYTEVIQWGLPALVVVLMIAGFYRGGIHTGKEMIWLWILTTGILAGLGSVLAMAHPLTILSAMVAAPVTTLHPLIAAGWVSGLVEAMLRKPKVKDLESLSGDILSIRGFWKNKVTRILLVVVFTNIGASIGTFVALPMIIKAF